VLTVEGLASNGRLDPVQEGFAQCHGLQCGFCTPGMMLTARWLLDHHPDPSAEQVREALSGQICRCTGYENIVRSVLWASRGAIAKRAAAEADSAAEADGAAGLDGAAGADGAGTRQVPR